MQSYQGIPLGMVGATAARAEVRKRMQLSETQRPREVEREIPDWLLSESVIFDLNKAAFLWWLNVLGVVAHGGLAFLTYWVSTQDGRTMATPLLTVYSTELTWTNSSTDMLIPTLVKGGEWHLSWMTVGFFVMSATAHFLIVILNWQGAWSGLKMASESWLFVTPRHNWYYWWIHDCRQPLRWIEYSFSASIMILTISISGGVNHIYVLTTFFTLMWCTMMFGYYNEILCRPAPQVVDATWTGPGRKWIDIKDAYEPRPGQKEVRVDDYRYERWLINSDAVQKWYGIVAFPYFPLWIQRLAPHMLGYVPYLTVWGVLGHSFLYNAVINSEQTPPTFVFIIVIGQFTVFTLFGITQLILGLFEWGAKYYYWGEVSYLILSLTAKALLGITLVASVLIFDTFEEAVENA